MLCYNRWIRSGYRAGLTHGQCLRSVVQHHTETGNILTHALPLLLVLAALSGGVLEP